MKAMDVPHKCVDLHSLNVIQRLQCCLDLPLVRLHVHDKYQCIVLFNLLHGAFGVQRMDEHFVMVQTRLMRNRFPRIFWVAGCAEGLWSVECGGESDLSRFLGMDLYRLTILAFAAAPNDQHQGDLRLSERLWMLSALCCVYLLWAL